ncbi:MAG: DUF4339 domain-containing protein [Candidatus Saccharimonas sp.]|nr:DUF4339 domain-containing protein [Planctomycetaceae bacterium]
MADQWFYRMFGEDFGPVPFEKLREMADKGTVAANDEVRSESSSRWVTAGSVDGLGLSGDGGGTAVATEGDSDTATDLSTTRVGLDDWYCMLHGNELGPLSFEELVKFAEHDNVSADDEVKLGANGKWRRVGSIGRLVAVLPYRAVESKTPVPATKSKPATKSRTPAAEQSIVESLDDFTPLQSAVAESVVQVDVQAAYQAAYEQAKAQIAESMMAQAEAAFKAAEESAKAELAWALAPNVDPEWWGWMGGVEFGPVGFMQVFALAKNGQLKPSDFVRNGPTGQYFPSSSAPGLLNAVATVAKAAEALKLAKVQAQAATALASPPPMVPPLVVSKPTSVVATPAANGPTPAAPHRDTGRTQSTAAAVSKRLSTESMDVTAVRTESPKRVVAAEPDPVAADVRPTVRPLETRPAPVSSAMSGGYSSSMSSSSSYSASRPVSAPVRPAPKPIPSRSSSSSSSSLSDSLAFLKDPKALGAVGVLAMLLLFVGWGYFPMNSAADVKHFHELKHIYDEIKVKRSNNSNDFTAVMTQAERVSKTITADLAKKASRDNPVKQSLLWAARDELPRVVTELKKGPATQSKAEINFGARLWDAANQLGLKDTGLPEPTPAPEIAANAPKPGFPND